MRRLAAAAAVALVLVAGVAAWTTWHLVGLLHEPYQGQPGAREIDVPSGAPAREILAQLENEGVLRDERLARAYLKWLGDPPLQAGRYLFDRPLSVPEVVERLRQGDVVQRRVTVVEGLTLAETAGRLAAAGFGERRRLEALMRDPSLIRDLDPEAEDLEGYLFPDSYQFQHGAGEEQVVRALVTTFKQRWRDEVQPLLPPAGRGLRDTVTLASIVEKEARLDGERPVIAGVYANRLERGIALYADPTIIFALKRRGTWDGNLRRDDLSLESPYNTYLHAGLTPGPICSPGLASLQAAARPADVPYLYFVSRNDGSHVFATTLAEHNRNVEQWQRRYWRRRWAEEGSEPRP